MKVGRIGCLNDLNLLQKVINEIVNYNFGHMKWASCLWNRLKPNLRIPSHKKYRISDENHAIELITHAFTCQKMGYIHENPVRSGFVEKAEDWMYSSQRNYCGLGNLLEIDLMDI